MSIRLTPTSFIVLGLVRWAPGSSAYDLETTIVATTNHMWTIQRSQIYREPQRLAEAGYLEATEVEGRRGTTYATTPKGDAALDAWLDEGADELPQLRDLSLLKVFFGTTQESLARTRLLQHQGRLKEFEVMRSIGTLGPDGPRRAIEAAILHERASIRFWSDLLKAGEAKQPGAVAAE